MVDIMKRMAEIIEKYSDRKRKIMGKRRDSDTFREYLILFHVSLMHHTSCLKCSSAFI